MEILRKYGEATTVVFPLIDRGTLDLVASVTIASGDIKIMKDEGAFANTDTASFVDETLGMYSIPLTDAEMTAARIVIRIVDTATKEWEDQTVIITTYGNASAQHTDTVWDEARADHTTAGSFGEGVIVEDFSTTGKASLKTQIHDDVTEGSLTFRQVTRIILSSAAGLLSGSDNSNPRFRDQANTKDRIVASTSTDGRSAVNVDGT